MVQPLASQHVASAAAAGGQAQRSTRHVRLLEHQGHCRTPSCNCLMMLQVAFDTNRKGILVHLGEDHSIKLLDPQLNLSASEIHWYGLLCLVWRPHDDFAKQLGGAMPLCPCCKSKRLAVHERITRNFRRVMGRDRTILMIGCVYRCSKCAGGCAAAVLCVWRGPGGGRLKAHSGAAHLGEAAHKDWVASCL